MRQLLITITLALAVALSASARTAAPPDLSGTWILNSAKSKLVKGNHVQSETLVIVYSGVNIQFHYNAVPGGKAWTTTYTVDGKEHVIKKLDDDFGTPLLDHPNHHPPPCYSDLSPQKVYTKANWKKSELTVELHSRWQSASAVYCPGENDSLLSGDRWSLSSDGRTLTRTSEAVQTASGQYPKQIFVYDKQ
jgi:hypothetical protein